MFLVNASLRNRAQCKVIRRSLVLVLIDVAKENGALEREKTYWNTYYCLSHVVVTEGKMYRLIVKLNSEQFVPLLERLILLIAIVQC